MLFIYILDPFQMNIKDSWSTVSFLSLKSLIVIALLIAASKYAFTLAKSYLTEALKISDRIHAIRFGEFFLRAYGDKVNSQEVKEVFQHWNISNTSSFSKLDTDKFDPKLIEAIINVVNLIKTNSSTKSNLKNLDR